ncbi:MAG TPA: hypothetical protein VFD84_01880 [Candidatus Binatia bacterium]|nr:hypothetical protein [Candidatus Binatia bacterium]
MHLRSVLVALAVLACTAAPAAGVRYRIDVFAGGGVAADPAATGDGRPAPEAVLAAPTGLARDRHGSVYVADHNHGRVRRIARRGRNRVITTVAGTGARGSSGDGGPAAAATFVRPTGVTVMPNGDLLVTDAGDARGGCTVRRIDRKGIVHAFAGVGDAPPGDAGTGGPARAAQLGTPLRTVVAPNGDVYIVELNANRIRVVRAATGTIEAFAGTGEPGDDGDEGPAVAARLRNPAGLVLGRHGTLYVSDFGNNRIRVVTPDGIIHALAGTGMQTGAIDGPGGDPADDLNDGFASAATFYKPTGLALDAHGALLVADQGNSAIRRIARDVRGRLSPDSLVTTIIGSGEPGYGGEGGDALAARFTIPTDVLPLPGGRLLVADRGNERVRIAVPVRGSLCSIACSDGDACTRDRCTSGVGCSHVPTGATSALCAAP